MNKLKTGVIWSFIQRFGSLLIGFISNILLARLLSPEDFGTIGMIMVFVGLADILVDGGLGNALIQKKNINNQDISTVFSANLVISTVLFLIIFILAPTVEVYTSIENFSLYLRFQSVMIIIRSLYVVHFSILNKRLDFKELARINIFANIFVVATAITMAFFGFGVWSLIFRNVLLDLTLFVIYSLRLRINLKIGFNRDKFKELFAFGSFVALSNLLESLYSNIVTFFIGKKYSVKELGYYGQAQSLVQIPVYSMTMVLNQVLFPFFSNIQDEKNQIKQTMKFSIQAISFCLYPIMIYLICLAKPIIILLYSDKWLLSVPYFQILCLTGIFNGLIHINRSVLKSLSLSRLLFKIQVALCCCGLIIIYIGFQFKLEILVFFIVLNSIISFVVTGLFAGKEVGYKVNKQFLDVLPSLSLSIVAGALYLLLFRNILLPNVIHIVLGLFFYVLTYILLHSIFKIDIYIMFKQYFINIIHRHIRHIN